MATVTLEVDDPATAEWVRTHPDEARRAIAAAAGREARTAFREQQRALHDRDWTPDDEADRTATYQRWTALAENAA